MVASRAVGTIVRRRGGARRRPVLLVALTGLAAGAGCAVRQEAPPVVLLTIDTLRADRLGCYGGPSPSLTPNLDRLAEEGARIDVAVAPINRTTQAVGTILTGLDPWHHGADGLAMPLPDRVTTVAEVFKARGYATAAFVTNLNLAPGLGFEQGFDIYSNPQPRWRENSARQLTDEALAWLEAQSGKRIFLWIHYLDPHWPYTPPPEVARRLDPDFAGWDHGADIWDRQRRHEVTKGQVIYAADTVLSPREIEHLRRLYDAEIAATDREVGRLLAGLARLGILDRAVLLFASDHGEALGDHRKWFSHGEYLYEDTLRVPMLVRAPGRVPAGTVLSGIVPLNRAAPTLLELAGAPVPGGLDGESLAPLLRRGGETRLPPAALMHANDFLHLHPENPRRPVKGRKGRWWALRDGSLKLIRIPLPDGRAEEELYDLAADPEEARNLAAARPDLLERMRGEFERRLAELLRSARFGEVPEALDPEKLDALRSLGYAN
ncbi:MAG: hypothetical protein D6718_11685 [Acidobacteria bacterium]|nr:MAG: hypothetical protein D6718_11685 [Acidobacteriota bacterium]